MALTAIKEDSYAFLSVLLFSFGIPERAVPDSIGLKTGSQNETYLNKTFQF